MIGNKIADKITNVSKKKTAMELYSKELPNNSNNNMNNNNNNKTDTQITTHKKRYISQEERKQIIEELSLVSKKYV